jgi:pimeloyl-ACP methyl ester carboxylesterase
VLARSTKPVAVLVGGADELMYAERYAPLLQAARPGLPVTIVPGVGHVGMIVAPAGIAALREAFIDMTAPAPGLSRQSG